MGRPGLGARLVAVPLRWLGLSAGVAALAASGLFGGLDTVEKPAVPTVGVGASTDAGPWKVTVTGGRLVGELPGLDLDKGNRWLAVLATVEVTAAESRGGLAEILRVSGVTGLVDDPAGGAPKHVIVVRDASRPEYLNPGIPEPLAFLWEHSGGAPVPTTLQVEVRGRTYRLDTIGNRMAWLDLEPRARVTGVPVEDRRGR